MEKMITIDGQEGTQYIQSVKQVCDRVMSFEISSEADFVAVGEELKVLKTKQKEITEKRMEMTRPLDQSKKNIMAFFKRPLDLIAQAEEYVKGKMLAWKQEQDRIRREEEARLQKIAEKEAEKLAKKAEKAEEKGNYQKADALREEAQNATMSIPTVQQSEPKVSGISTKKVWKFQIVDVDAIPREWMIPDEKRIGATVRGSRGAIKIAGVRIYCEEVIASGGR